MLLRRFAQLGPAVATLGLALLLIGGVLKYQKPNATSGERHHGNVRLWAKLLLPPPSPPRHHEEPSESAHGHRTYHDSDSDCTSDDVQPLRLAVHECDATDKKWISPIITVKDGDESNKLTQVRNETMKHTPYVSRMLDMCLSVQGGVSGMPLRTTMRTDFEHSFRCRNTYLQPMRTRHLGPMFVGVCQCDVRSVFAINHQLD